MIRVWRLSVAYIGPKSRTERPSKTKIGTEVAHVTRWLGHRFQSQKVKGQLAGGGGILWRPPAQLVVSAVLPVQFPRAPWELLALDFRSRISLDLPVAQPAESEHCTEDVILTSHLPLSDDFLVYVFTSFSDTHYSVVKVRGRLGGSAPCSHLSPPAIVWAPLIESIKCYLCLNNAKLVGLEWVWGLLQPGFVSPPPCFTKPL